MTQRYFPIFEHLDARRLFAVNISIISITPDSRFFDPSSLPPVVNYTVTFHNNLASSYSYAGLDLVAGDVFLSKDHIPGNNDDITESGSIAPLAIQGHQTISVHDGTFILGTLEPGSYYLGSNFRMIDGTTQKTAIQKFITATPVITVFGAPLPSTNIIGTPGDDVIEVGDTGNPLGQAFVVINGVPSKLPASYPDVYIDAGLGDDKVYADPGLVFSLHVTGAGGDDTLIGGAAYDELSGANGKDRVYGGGGLANYLLGGAGADRLYGGAGKNTLSGGGGNDRLYAGADSNHLYGGAGNDILIARNGFSDTVSGNSGDDSAQIDDLLDTATSIKTFL